MLKNIKKDMNLTGTTNNLQLEKEIKVLQKRYKNYPDYGGMLIDPTNKELNLLQKTEKNNHIFYLVNNLEHWTAIAKKATEWYEYDSFGRNLKTRKFKDFETTFTKVDQNGGLQKMEETDCGMRVLAAMYELFEKVI